MRARKLTKAGLTDVTTYSISVPIGAYHDLLPTSLASLAAQGEGVGVSLLDASGDARVVALADHYNRLFSYRRHGPDGGQSAAIIEGWRHTGGDILGWLNADDFLFPGVLQTARDVFDAHGDVDVVTGHSAICDEAGRMTGYHWAVEPPGENLRAGCVISQPSCFFRRRAYEAAGGLDASLHFTMDWDLWLRLFDSGARFHFVDQVFSAVYWGEGTKTLGLSPGRRRELWRLIANHTPPEKQFRAKRGFILRALLDEMRPAALSRALEAGLRRKPPAVYGVGPQGTLSGTATLCWTHYDDAPKAGLAIKLDGAEAVAGVDCSAPAKTARTAEGVTVTFADPQPAASLVRVALTLEKGRAARLVQADWF